MPALARGDAEWLLRFVAEAEELGGDEPFPGETLAALGQLIRADLVDYSEVDFTRYRILVHTQRTGDPPAQDDEERLRTGVVDHPILPSRKRGHFRAATLSDFVSLRELRRTSFYQLALAPYGIERELTVSIPSPISNLKSFMFVRAGKDFSQRDRLVLDLLQPHFAHLWRAAAKQRKLAAALAGLGHGNEHDSRGVILLDCHGRVDFVSPPTRRLVREFLPGIDALSDWLATGSRGSLAVYRGTRVLTVERVGEALFLEETREDALTPREREVMALLTRGVSNAEIAQALWLAPDTVRKHLENVYKKLGAHTRTAAVAAFLGLSDSRENSPEERSPQ